MATSATHTPLAHSHGSGWSDSSAQSAVGKAEGPLAPSPSFIAYPPSSISNPIPTSEDSRKNADQVLKYSEVRLLISKNAERNQGKFIWWTSQRRQASIIHEEPVGNRCWLPTLPIARNFMFQTSQFLKRSGHPKFQLQRLWRCCGELVQ